MLVRELMVGVNQHIFERELPPRASFLNGLILMSKKRRCSRYLHEEVDFDYIPQLRVVPRFIRPCICRDFFIGSFYQISCYDLLSKFSLNESRKCTRVSNNEKVDDYGESKESIITVNSSFSWSNDCRSEA